MYANAIICMYVGGWKFGWVAVGGRVYINGVICKHFRKWGVTEEHLMCPNAITCMYVS